MDILDILYRASWTVLILSGALVSILLTVGIFLMVGVDR